MPHSKATQSIYSMEIRGIALSTIRDGTSRIVNDPGSHPDRVGTPKGHPPITCFLGVPLKQMGRTIGMIGLANKESGYDTADQQAIETLSVAFAEALMRSSMRERRGVEVGRNGLQRSLWGKACAVPHRRWNRCWCRTRSG